MKYKHCLRLITVPFLFLCLVMLPPPLKSHAAEIDNTGLCGSISLEKASGVLGVPVADLHKTSSKVLVSPEDLLKKTFTVEPVRCTIRSKTNYFKGISYIVYLYNVSAKALMDFKKIKEGFETVSKLDMVPGVGDETFWVADSRFQRMVTVKGDMVIDVLSPKEFDLQKQITLLVLSKKK